MLEEVLGSPTKIRILRRLVARPNREYTIRELARGVGLSLGTVHPALRQLVGSRVVLTHRVGRSLAVRVNATHPLYPALVSLFRDEASAFLPIARAFADAMPPDGLQAAILFGSVARGEAGPRSDIDVLVVVDNRGRVPAIRKAATAILDRFDAVVVPVILTRAEVESRLRSFDPLLLTIAAEGRRLRGRAPWLGR